MDDGNGSIRLGLRENLGQFSLLVLINMFVGMMVGLERTVVPLIGEKEFGLVSKTAIVSFIVSFGVTKAVCNLFAARASETMGRKKLLVAGWLVGLPVPFIIIFANRWFWFDVANVLLGVNQALCWSMTVIMKVDLVGPKRRGLALGLNEFAGYLALGFTAWITGYIASVYALRPQPFYLGIGVAFAGLLLSWLLAKETRQYAKLEAKLHHASVAAVSVGDNGPSTSQPSMREIFAQASWKDRNLFSCSQAGLVNNLNDGMSWGIYPLFFSSFGLGVGCNRDYQSCISCRPGCSASLHRAAERPLGTEVADRGRDDPASRCDLAYGRSSEVHSLDCSGSVAGGRHGDGLPHAAGGDYRRCPS
jgi:MFS family permease